MKPTWHRISTSLIGDDEPGTCSMFFDYNLARWTIGFWFDFDPCWYEIAVDIGPFQFSLIYWRADRAQAGSP